MHRKCVDVSHLLICGGYLTLNRLRGSFQDYASILLGVKSKCLFQASPYIVKSFECSIHRFSNENAALTRFLQKRVQ